MAAVPPDHQLCGYLCAVVAITGDANIPINSLCSFSVVPPDIYFVAENGARLIPIDRVLSADSAVALSLNSRKKKMGMVHGSISVVVQLHELLKHKCLRIFTRVVKVSRREGEAVGGSEEFRALILVDVYLPNALWSGWQLPRSKAVAASVFSHLRCDWESRNLILRSFELNPNAYYSIWNAADCHILHCRRKCTVPGNPKKKKLFELQEIFKSLSCRVKEIDNDGSHLKPTDMSSGSGISTLPDDVLINILSRLRPANLVQISLTCRHFRHLASSVMPCMKLKLYPHQLAAVEWMLQREKECRVLQHPLYISFKTAEGFDFHINLVSGDVSPGLSPSVMDFRGGLFCDEPGLGKTITALSLILKQQGTIAEPPDGALVIWCVREGDSSCGYYEISSDKLAKGNVSNANKISDQKVRRGQLWIHELTPKMEKTTETADSCPSKPAASCTPPCSTPLDYKNRSMRSCNSKRKLLDSFEGPSVSSEIFSKNKRLESKKYKKKFRGSQIHISHGESLNKEGDRQHMTDNLEDNETWVQCDFCSKWRKITNGHIQSTSTAWFCRMNTNASYQSCSAPEEAWDQSEPITYLPGFLAKGSSRGQEENISFFISVLREHSSLINSETKKALTWMAKLSPRNLEEMETVGLKSPIVATSFFDSKTPRAYHKIFLAFGLRKKIEKGSLRWCYPPNLLNLTFDLDSLRIALREPLDSLRFYLSSATLIVVPTNLVDHWMTQIERHVSPGQLRVYVWSDQKKKPSPHNLAWDYDVVITTFNRLSAEWSPNKRSVLTQIHWLRLMLDEGHTLGSSLSLTNKLQMAISLTAQSRWLLTGTPTPNTPISQVSCLQPMLKFLREEVYGLHLKSWEAGILRPYEAEMEEGRSRLMQLLNRCMICSRKIHIRAIPPCKKKVILLDFSQVHAESYNQLVETVRRNILMADWNDPSHVESLLNTKQWKFRAATIRNLRLSCCVAGHVMVINAEQDIQETMEMLVDNGLDPTSQEHDCIKNSLLLGGECMRCLEWCRLPVITPCRHLLCIDCVALESEKCTMPGCGHLYEMQSPKELARPENPNPKWPVPKDLIELQPSYKQDDWNPHWQSTSSSKAAYLVRQLKELQKAGSADSRRHAPEKVIIFSQFLEHIHVIEQQLNIAGIRFAGLYSPMHSSNKMKSLTSFQQDWNCMALLMDGSVALGLDLSFVSHVYLMEPIWDRSMEEQVISRAHRMGATRPVHVETLAMKGTIEEEMLNFLQDGGCVLKEDFEGSRNGERSTFRTLHDFGERNYLTKLGFVRSNSNFPTLY
ncbi:hypothetical protein M569_08193 [Genlisea aurea]|uniref:F-box protein At3g54460 n=1 Tax=Genlisea aurea TaxID=192259 RepID=S8DTU1_9LAMI|nr:hypothetical protein M569_08193 [Genlisea aurea]